MLAHSAGERDVRVVSDGQELLEQLNRRLERDVVRFRESHVWRVLSSAASSTQLLSAVLRELYWEIHCYQPFTTKAGFAMIGGADVVDRKRMRTMLLHKWEEVEHRQWALDCYLALGGDPRRGAALPMSAQSFAVCAVWERMSARCGALSYVGAEYLFEALTARLTPIVADVLAKRGFGGEALQFITEHAVEDQKHQQLFAKLIVEIGNAHPEGSAEILYCYDCFNAVYPMPVWEACVARAEVSGAHGE
jgi:hypothetical protein